jgi:hypothetical protein
MTTIDEQIEYMQSIVATSLLPTHMPKSILASLERLKKIDEAQVPDDPGTIDCSKSSHKQILHVERADYDTLRDLLRRVTAERDSCAQTNDDQSRRVFAAEAELAETKRLLAEANERIKYYKSITTGSEHKAIDAAIKEQK